MSEKFSPSFGMKNKHIQTLYQTFFRKIKEPNFEIEKFILEDGDFLENYWHKIKNSQNNTPIAIIFHGLAGSYESPYIKGIMNSLATAGYNSVLMHFRGCSGKVNNLPRSYHSGETGDALYFIDSLKKIFPNAKLFAVGFSLGGNMLLKLLGEVRENSLLSGAVSISPPMELDICANAINQGFSRIYERHLVNDLNKGLIKKYAVNDIESYIGINVKEVKKLKTFWEFDSAYTAPIHGFKSAQDYYTKCSSRQFLKDIHTPTLIIHSKDDPFMNTKMIPQKHEMSKNVSLELSEYGGHVGFIEGGFFTPKYWLESRIVDFFNEELDSKN
ncbi:MAG: putative alpha/beta-fold hydrolase [Sulfurimonas sp.]|uniref:hydrolase n=1 Tax=Sulfurimonas sp. TaxID=2022749 RepID=UPI0039E71AFC